MFPLLLPLPAEQFIANFQAFKCERIQHQTSLFSTFCFIAHSCRKGVFQRCSDSIFFESDSSPYPRGRNPDPNPVCNRNTKSESWKNPVGILD